MLGPGGGKPQDVRLVALAIAGALAAAGCGPSAHKKPERAAQVVFLQRNGGLAATLDTVAVRTDGSVRLERRYGGAGGRFTDFHLRARDLHRVQHLVATGAVARPGSATGHPARGGYTYIVRDDHHTATGVQGALPLRLAPLVKLLDDILDGQVPRQRESQIAVASP
jgi:hypothetical protein